LVSYLGYESICIWSSPFGQARLDQQLGTVEELPATAKKKNQSQIPTENRGDTIANLLDVFSTDSYCAGIPRSIAGQVRLSKTTFSIAYLQKKTSTTGRLEQTVEGWLD